MVSPPRSPRPKVTSPQTVNATVLGERAFADGEALEESEPQIQSETGRGGRETEAETPRRGPGPRETTEGQEPPDVGGRHGTGSPSQSPGGADPAGALQTVRRPIPAALGAGWGTWRWPRWRPRGWDSDSVGGPGAPGQASPLAGLSRAHAELCPRPARPLGPAPPAPPHHGGACRRRTSPCRCPFPSCLRPLFRTKSAVGVVPPGP